MRPMTPAKTPLTIGTVPYLNALPLVEPLAEQGLDILRAVPSRLAPMLDRGECDVALIPVVEWFRGVGSELISDACIASSHEVRSVLLFHRKPVEEVRSIALDQSSRTSVALLKIILQDAYGISPESSVLSPDLAVMLEDNDGALLIGDAALEARAQCAVLGAQILDLGLAWTKLTSLPFVYAAWIARHELPSETQTELAGLLSAARDNGVQRFQDLSLAHATPALTAAAIFSYFSGAIEYQLTPAHRAGLDEFRRRCEAHGLV